MYSCMILSIQINILNQLGEKPLMNISLEMTKAMENNAQNMDDKVNERRNL